MHTGENINHRLQKITLDSSANDIKGAALITQWKMMDRWTVSSLADTINQARLEWYWFSCELNILSRIFQSTCALQKNEEKNKNVKL